MEKNLRLKKYNWFKENFNETQMPKSEKAGFFIQILKGS